ncbi:hypothetical protein BT96DRAFT_1012387 [Gymnopus androsaceus JB14]|uniref:Uncharacterized protein n=1 Tax=Gymnopus androsaceus JB14 TaxID=1447944 RepID=A0A6A4IJP9_9AGAR|nr:hypothetical protein BT96DRAFT_1012387 [Gymnopus androsaceus JB14]
MFQGGDENLDPVYEYFVGHCHHVIDGRIRKVLDVYFPTDDLGNLLTWEFKGPIEPAEVEVATDFSPYQFLLAVKIPHSNNGDVSKFTLNSSSASKWIDSLYHVLVYIQSSLKLKSKNGLERASQALVALHWFISYIIPTQLWASESLDERLQSLRLKHWDLTVEDSLPSESRSSMKEECSIFFRAIDAICAWTVAPQKLVKHKLFSQANTVFTVQIFDMPNVELPAVELDENVLTRWNLAGDDSEYVRQQSKSANDKGQVLASDKDKGRVHCEAGLLAALACDETTLRSLQHDQQTMIVALIRTLKDQETYVIGVAKKCCPTCRHLATVIEQYHSLKLDLPGSHTRYHAWRPPAWLSDEILLKLETLVLSDVHGMLKKRSYGSRASSPGSDKSNSKPPKLPNLPEY